MEHVAQRPTWDCRACERPWPCDPAREGLAKEMQPTPLRIYMWTQLELAIEDMPHTPSGELFARFLRWT